MISSQVVFIVLSSLFLSSFALPQHGDNLILRNSWRATDSRAAAASCCAEGQNCDDLLAISSGTCKSGVWMSQQPRACQETACKYCVKSRSNGTIFAINGKTKHMICRSESIQKNCFRKSESSPQDTGKPIDAHKKEPPVSTSIPPKQNGCVYKGSGGTVYIPARGFKVTRPWRVMKDSIVWKPGGNRKIDRRGSGATCVPFRSDRSGHHYLTMFTSAPARTEHNDAWMKFSGGLDFFQPKRKSWRQGGKGFYKFYQNAGKNKKVGSVVTFDQDPHQAITRKLKAGTTYHVCIAGRSSRFRIYSVVAIACNGGENCSRFNRKMKRALGRARPSRCIK